MRQKIKTTCAQVGKKSQPVEHVRRISTEDAAAHGQAGAGQSSDAQEIDQRLAPLPQQQVSQARNGPSSLRGADAERGTAGAAFRIDRFVHVHCPHASSAGNSVCTAPVTSALPSATYTFTSLRTPNSGR